MDEMNFRDLMYPEIFPSWKSNSTNHFHEKFRESENFREIDFPKKSTIQSLRFIPTLWDTLYYDAQFFNQKNIALNNFQKFVPQVNFLAEKVFDRCG